MADSRHGKERCDRDEDKIILEESPIRSGPDRVGVEEDDEEETSFSRWTLPILLFLLTVFTTLWAGAYQAYNGAIRGPVAFLSEHPDLLWKGIPFAATLLFILVTHELGHFVLSKIHGVPASLPLFIPGPPHFIGTFGAIIRIRGPQTRAEKGNVREPVVQQIGFGVVGNAGIKVSGVGDQIPARRQPACVYRAAR